MVEQINLSSSKIKMKKSILLALFITSPAFALEVGECIAIESSKHYITRNFQEPTPKTVRFTCDYECRSSNGRKKITAESSVYIPAGEDGNHTVVCEGINLVKTSWGFQGKVEPYYAFKSKLYEINNWAFSNLSFQNEIEDQIIEKAQKQFYQVAIGFLTASNSGPQFKYYADAAAILFQISGELESGIEITLDEQIYILVQNKGEVIAPKTSADFLVQSQVSNLFSHRVKVENN